MADADTNYVLPYYVQDFNQDGKLDQADEQAPPGNMTPSKPFKEAFTKAVVTPEYTDQWDTFISGCAPIQDGQGVTKGIFCVDENVRAMH